MHTICWCYGYISQHFAWWLVIPDVHVEPLIETHLGWSNNNACQRKSFNLTALLPIENSGITSSFVAKPFQNISFVMLHLSWPWWKCRQHFSFLNNQNIYNRLLIFAKNNHWLSHLKACFSISFSCFGF